MYLLYDDRPTLPISFFGLSVILHGLVILLAMGLALKMAESKPIKKEMIEFELTTKAILRSALPVKNVRGVPHPVTPAPPTKAKIKSAKIEQANLSNRSQGKTSQDKTKSARLIPSTAPVVKAPMAKLAAAPTEASEDFSPNEDFADIKLKGAAWHEDADIGIEPEELSEQSENTDSYSALNEKYEAKDLDSDLSEAGKKNSIIARTQAEKIENDLEKDASALTANTEKYIENEKKNGFLLPSKKSSNKGQSELGSATATRSVVGASNNKMGNSKFGDESAVRALKDLRQTPGNRKPMYTIADRRASKQGSVVYYAFINSNGRPERFALIKSSGHQTLDSNTLLALKKWRFYPGQKGWVELPFYWSLKGGAVEAPSLLRR